jgi:hypothetical protein
MYKYIQSEPGLWTVGFYDPQGKWVPESDHTSTVAAAQRVNYLNGQLVAGIDNEDPFIRPSIN